MAQHFRRLKRGELVSIFNSATTSRVNQIDGTLRTVYNWWELQGHQFRTEVIPSDGPWANDTIELMFIDDIGAQIWDKLYDEYKQRSA